MTTARCSGCDVTYTRTNRKQTYCTPACRITSTAAKKAAADEQLRLDVEWLAGTDGWESIATRLGFASLAAFERKLQRIGEHEWARRAHEQSLDSIRWGKAA